MSNTLVRQLDVLSVWSLEKFSRSHHFVWFVVFPTAIARRAIEIDQDHWFSEACLSTCT